ncbi:JmjC domain, hydroxylase-domain-containing protein, partial [Jimgerdemannia flammicorona]
MDLYSINYLHFGAPKQWYAIPSQHRQKFERVMQSIFFQEHKKCSQFLRHKTFIVSPAVLANHQIPVHRLVQREGEFVITFPFGYHSGYNLGFNCAESVNFALSSWVQIGKMASACQCVGDSVKIDVSIFERREEGEKEEGWGPRARARKKGLVRIKLKNKANEGLEEAKDDEEDYEEDDEAISARTPTKQKRKRVIRKEGEDEEGGETGSEMSPKRRGTKKSAMGVGADGDMDRRGNSLTGMFWDFFIPDTMIVQSVDGKDIVSGVPLIPKGRWKLCNINGFKWLRETSIPSHYRNAKYATNQAAQTCTFHPICARESGVTINETPFEDGSVLYEGFCYQHDPVGLGWAPLAIRAEAKRSAQKESELKQIADRLRQGARVWARWKGGSFYE